ncbi:MAG TPA: prolyl aminopeptidase [Candidatus Pacebacteria bacterium]|nr:MAG: Proline iminopeptidase [Microgenomates group bacterium GW2011_GWB1_45_17]KKU23027.1 MAG: Proline iminopeptidase [Microgenomates group bacterium GW2011_GWA1_46_15]KKU24757.1 MAG: Proline iminopeptidase [Microgenomates group bacterium GW2011_GWC1_46_15]HAV15403.1 prolyl aminopeptidase [Candidatus Paceibacterota bacterium]HCR11538.1 prolyl aminopeptidase [Candidatus Paceibacterota bacterium]
MNTLFPPFEPYKIEQFPVSNIHTLYLEQSGNPQGKPIIALHGGPGSHSKPDHRCLFDPKKYHIILFDQRGCGKSTPAGELRENTTDQLVEDIEKIRRRLSIDTWIVHGGSWGSALALAYAEKYSQHVKALIVRGVFTFRKWEIDWVYKNARLFYPDVWDEVCKVLNFSEGDNFGEKMKKILLSGNKTAITKAVKVYTIWSAHLMKLFPVVDRITPISESEIYSAQIMFHYVQNNGFLKEGQLLDKATVLQNIPTAIIQGRYDVCCPPLTAWELHKKLPQSELVFVQDAGHKGDERGIIDKVIEYTNKFSTL